MSSRLAVLAAVVAIGAASLAATTPAQAPSAKARAGAPAGFVDHPLEAAILGPRVEIRGWTHAPAGIRSVEVRWQGGRREAEIGLPRPDVAAARPDVGAAANGWRFTHDFTSEPIPPGWDRRRLEVVATGKDGQETRLAIRDLVEPRAFTRWNGLPRAAFPFYLLPATSGVSLGGANELDTDYRAYVSPTVQVGVRVPILYLRTTRGRAHDYAYDPDWDVERRCGGERRIADDSLNGVLKHSAARRLPVLLTLNGGVWADAGCDVPEWDLNDLLEKDPANCQWNEKGEVMSDDALKHLPGSAESPELGRSLTFNVYASEVRRLKKRNLQQAARLVADFDRRNPGLLVGVSLDPDVYLNPFYAQRQWYDYNPGTLRQFREWLAVTGPYAGRPGPGVPDLRRFARAAPMTLERAGSLAGRTFRSWEEVDPPRAFPREGPRPFWKDPWTHEWEMFRRHLVQLHYEELSAWIVEAGIGPDRVWTAQGFTPHYDEDMPLATRIASSVRNYDTAGVSIEGSKPASGHLGAIIYGPSASNEVILEEGASLFATFASYDRNWAAVEFNTTALRTPRLIPPPERGYRALRELWNHQARFVSPMAWNGAHGHYTDHPAYVPFTSWRGTPAEEAAKDFMLARAGLPRGTRLWTFGIPAHADLDGWTAAAGTIAARPASLRVAPGAGGRAVIDSPRELAIDSPMRLVVHAAGEGDVEVEVWGRARGAPRWNWTLLGRGNGRAGVPLPSMPGGIDQLRVAMPLAAGPLVVERIAALPVRK